MAKKGGCGEKISWKTLAKIRKSIYSQAEWR